MKQSFLVLFILADLGIMGGAGFFLYKHLTSGAKPVTPAVTPTTNPIASVSPATSSGTASSLITPVATNVTPGASSDASMRKILFTYHNPKARQVAIRADFTGWKAEAMARDDRGVWTYQAHLLPGEYAYCFTVDDKTFKDPANKRTKQIGRTFVSAIVVEAKAS